MRPFSRQSFVMVAILLLALLTTAGGFWWLCTRSNEIAFLPRKPGAEWIVYPKPPDTATHQAVPVRAVFQHVFTLDAAPTNAAVAVCAFKSIAVTINGQKVSKIESTAENWKSPSTADVTGLLRAGTNDITAYVTNALGPPALWLRLQTGQLSLGTDEHWQVSLAGAAWQDARCATRPPVILPWNYIYGGEGMLDSVKRVWPVVAVFCAISLGLVLAAVWWRRTQAPFTSHTRTKLIYSLLVLVVIARATLFLHNLPQLPRSMGFDTQGHEQYIQFIQEKHALPLPSDGWEMQQPPLYYAVSAAFLDTCGLPVNTSDAGFLLRTVNGVVGLVHCWLALLCLRLLFPENLAAQAVGLVIAAFLPPHLYLSQYVTNEPLAGLFVTVAFYLCLLALRSEKESRYLPAGIGLALGAAMLTKVSSLLAVPFFALALGLGLRLLSHKNYFFRDWLRTVGAVVLLCAVVCGWHYGRVWAHFGRPIVLNFESDAGSPYWQDPGFRTSAEYFRFGQVLVCPLFSAFHSFADGIYSTLWGDGLTSGTVEFAFRPPWNYDLMNAEYLLAIGISILFLAGFVLTVFNLIRRPTAEWFLASCLVASFSVGILYMSLSVPAYPNAKAFYGFPALVPFSALVAAGWNWLGQKNRALRAVLWVVLLVWTMTTYATFWIRSDNPETYRVRGIYQATQGDYTDALVSLSQALQLHPDDAAIHCIMAEILNDQYQVVEAVQHYRTALRIKPDFPEALNNLALILATSKEADIRNAAHAIQLAERACELTLYGTPSYISTLAVAYAEAGRFDDAIATAQTACEVASESNDKDLLKENQAFLAINLNNLAWTLATSKETNIRKGTRAVQLAERACKLTDYKQTILIGTLAAAYAEAGRFDEAIATAEKACALASESGDQNLLKRNQELLELYRKHQPYHEAVENPIPAAP
jgi:Flp pilus assembly protein TadD